MKKLIFISLIGLLFYGCTGHRISNDEHLVIVRKTVGFYSKYFYEVHRNGTFNFYLDSDSDYSLGTNLKLVRK